MFDFVGGIDVARRAFLDHQNAARLIGIGNGLNGRILSDQQTKPCCQIRIGKGDGFRPLRRCRHGRNDQVNFVSLQRRDQAVEADVLNFHVPAEEISQITRQVHAYARGVSVRVGHLEWRIGQFHADDQLSMRLGGAARQQGGKENESDESHSLNFQRHTLKSI